MARLARNKTNQPQKQALPLIIYLFLGAILMCNIAILYLIIK
jgi:hypothetical protein